MHPGLGSEATSPIKCAAQWSLLPVTPGPLPLHPHGSGRVHLRAPVLSHVCCVLGLHSGPGWASPRVPCAWAQEGCGRLVGQSSLIWETRGAARAVGGEGPSMATQCAGRCGVPLTAKAGLGGAERGSALKGWSGHSARTGERGLGGSGQAVARGTAVRSWTSCNGTADFHVDPQLRSAHGSRRRRVLRSYARRHDEGASTTGPDVAECHRHCPRSSV